MLRGRYRVTVLSVLETLANTPMTTKFRSTDAVQGFGIMIDRDNKDKDNAHGITEGPPRRQIVVVSADLSEDYLVDQAVRRLFIRE